MSNFSKSRRNKKDFICIENAPESEKGNGDENAALAGKIMNGYGKCIWEMRNRKCIRGMNVRNA